MCLPGRGGVEVAAWAAFGWAGLIGAAGWPVVGMGSKKVEAEVCVCRAGFGWSCVLGGVWQGRCDWRGRLAFGRARFGCELQFWAGVWLGRFDRSRPADRLPGWVWLRRVLWAAFVWAGLARAGAGARRAGFGGASGLRGLAAGLIRPSDLVLAGLGLVDAVCAASGWAGFVGAVGLAWAGLIGRGQPAICRAGSGWCGCSGAGLGWAGFVGAEAWAGLGCAGLIGPSDLALAGLGLVDAVCAAFGWAGFLGVAGWSFAGLGSLETLRS